MAMTADNRVRHLRFMSNFHEAVNKLIETVNQRQKEYNTTAPVQEHLPTPEDALRMAKLKVSRVTDQLQRWREDPDNLAKASTQDNIIDAMAYLGFLFAWLEEPRD